MGMRSPVRRPAGLVAAAVLGLSVVGIATAVPAAADVVTANGVVTVPANTCAVTFHLVGASGGDTSGGVGGLGGTVQARGWVQAGDTFYVELGQLPTGSTGGVGGPGNGGHPSTGGDGGADGAGGGGGTGVRLGSDATGQVWATAGGGGGAGSTADGGNAGPNGREGEDAGAVHGGQQGVGPDPGGPGYRDPDNRQRGDGTVAGGAGQETTGGGGGGGWAGGGGGGSDATDGAGGGGASSYARYGWQASSTATAPGPGSADYTWETCETPLAPALAVTRVGDTTVDVEFTPAAVDPNHPRSVVTGWEYVVDGGSAQPLASTSRTPQSPHQATITGLSNGAHSITVHARSASGAGADSAPVDAIPYAQPALPAEVPASNGALQTAAASTVDPGGTLIVTGSGFMPHSTVTLAVYSEPQVLTIVAADASGAFSVEVRLPGGLPPGQHTVAAAGVDATGAPRYLTLPITVPDPAAVLAYTGADVTGPLIGGLAALVVGSALLVVGRRPRATRTGGEA